MQAPSSKLAPLWWCLGGTVLGAGTERVVALYCGEVGELSAGDVADWVGEIAGAVKEGEICDWGPRRRRRD